jgi:predicted O-methyltransferase YrrM
VQDEAEHLLAQTNSWIEDLEPFAIEVAVEAVAYWQAVQKEQELAGLLTQVLRRDRPTTRILEIGSERGGTLRAFRTIVPDATIVSVSLSEAPYAKAPAAGQLDDIADTWIDAPSQYLDTVQAALKALGGTPDVVFIDGDHSYCGALIDAARYGAALEPGGLLAMHDILVHPHFPECQVWRVWPEVREGGAWYDAREYVVEPETWGGIGTVTRR